MMNLGTGKQILLAALAGTGLSWLNSITDSIPSSSTQTVILCYLVLAVSELRQRVKKLEQKKN